MSNLSDQIQLDKLIGGDDDNFRFSKKNYRVQPVYLRTALDLKYFRVLPTEICQKMIQECVQNYSEQRILISRDGHVTGFFVSFRFVSFSYS